MFNIALILAISAICFAGEALSASTVSAVKVYDAEMAKAKAEYDRKDDAAKKVLIAALTKAQATEMKANNLEGALAIKKKIEELTPKIDNILGDSADVIIGKWKRTDGHIQTFNKDGTGFDTGANKAFKWTYKNEVYVIVFTGDSSWRDEVVLNNNNVGFYHNGAQNIEHKVQEYSRVK